MRVRRFVLDNTVSRWRYHTMHLCSVFIGGLHLIAKVLAQTKEKLCLSVKIEALDKLTKVVKLKNI